MSLVNRIVHQLIDLASIDCIYEVHRLIINNTSSYNANNASLQDEIMVHYIHVFYYIDIYDDPFPQITNHIDQQIDHVRTNEEKTLVNLWDGILHNMMTQFGQPEWVHVISPSSHIFLHRTFIIQELVLLFTNPKKPVKLTVPSQFAEFVHKVINVINNPSITLQNTEIIHNNTIFTFRLTGKLNTISSVCRIRLILDKPEHDDTIFEYSEAAHRLVARIRDITSVLETVSTGDALQRHIRDNVKLPDVSEEETRNLIQALALEQAFVDFIKRNQSLILVNIRFETISTHLQELVAMQDKAIKFPTTNHHTFQCSEKMHESIHRIIEPHVSTFTIENGVVTYQRTKDTDAKKLRDTITKYVDRLADTDEPKSAYQDVLAYDDNTLLANHYHAYFDNLNKTEFLYETSQGE